MRSLRAAVTDHGQPVRPRVASGCRRSARRETVPACRRSA
jgi:hypothetical protein